MSLLRPTLLPGLKPLWRDRHTVQLGIDPARAVVVQLPHPAAGKVLDLLDGSRTERSILADMARIGLSEETTRTLLTSLVDAGLVVAAHTILPTAMPRQRRDQLVGEATALAMHRRDGRTPAEILRRRDRARVIVAGAGRFADLIAQTLLDSGASVVGRVSKPGDAATVVDGGRTLRTTDASFVVQVGFMTHLATRATRNGTPHLAVDVRDGVAVTGPLVSALGGPCLRCLDLHRSERDPAWPILAGQLAKHQADQVGDQMTCSMATMLMASGFATAEVLAYVDGALPVTVGITVEINGSGPWRRRHWTPHPSCDCTPRRARKAAPYGDTTNGFAPEL